ncbi:MAG: hypothetical protein IPN40_04395 [Uliginosibacterium sp.]|nr:hypothetical protein [Uliginosibacterium sp.]
MPKLKFRLIRHAFVPALLAALACSVASAATLCKADEVVIFHCALRASPQVVSVCASPGLTRTVGGLQFRLGAPDTPVERVYPADPAGAQALFFWQERRPYHSSLKEISFRSEGVVYTLSALEGAAGLSGTTKGFQGGELLIEKTRGGEKLARLSCEAYPEGTLDLAGIVADAAELAP